MAIAVMIAAETSNKVESEKTGEVSSSLDIRLSVGIAGALELGLRNRVLQEYFGILIKAEKFELYPRNSKKFRAVKPIRGYLAKNPI